MSITVKELAKMCNLSEAAVSMALRNKPGVSSETRRRIMELAKQHGYDFSRALKQAGNTRHITFAIYKRQGAVVGETPFFSELSEGIEIACADNQYNLQIAYIHKGDDVQKKIDEISYSDCSGIVLLGTEMQEEDFSPFSNLQKPMVVLDVYLDFLKYDCVLINNIQGALIATDYLISRTMKQPGYLKSSYPIANFDERADGFYKAVRRYGMSTSKSVVHKLTPSIDGACADMLRLMEQGEELASCYFADNDWVAIGAMKAFQQRGFRIPDDIAIIGFDNVPLASYIEPALTTIHVPKRYMGEMAVSRLLSKIGNQTHSPIKIEISTTLVKRRTI